MKSRKISKSNAKLTEIEMEQVVGGFMTGYFFPFVKAEKEGWVMWIEEPITIAASLDPYTAVCELFGNNFQFCVESSKGHYKVTSENEFKKFVKDYDNKHGSQWSKPATYGNVIATVNLANMDVDWV